MRYIIIGDIHGCYNELIKLIELVGEIGPEDYLIFMGDLTDRGPCSYEVMEYAKHQKERYGDHFVYIMGNHDYMMIKSENNREEYECWFYNGASKTQKSFEQHGKDLFEYVEWVKDNAVSYYQTPNFDVCHGGSLMEDISKDTEYSLVWDRDALINGNRGGKLIVVGHTPLMGPTHSGLKAENRFQELPYEKKLKLPQSGVIGIDTGCVFGEKLTAMIVEDDVYYLIHVKGEKRYVD